MTGVLGWGREVPGDHRSNVDLKSASLLIRIGTATTQQETSVWSSSVFDRRTGRVIVPPAEISVAVLAEPLGSIEGLRILSPALAINTEIEESSA